MNNVEKTTEQWAEERAAFYAERDITYSAEFVPQSKSRNANEKNRSLNWRVTVSNKRGKIETDYMQGIGHIPDFNHNERITLEVDERYKLASEEGKIWRGNKWHTKKLPEPKIDDVMYSLVADSDVLDYATFEDWAQEFGYDEDSRKGEKTYRACLTIALQMRAMLGDKGMQRLRTLFEGY